MARYSELLNAYIIAPLGGVAVASIILPEVSDIPAVSEEKYTPGPAQATEQHKAEHVDSAHARQVTDSIGERLARGEEPDSIEGYITSGGQCHIYRDPNTGYIVKIPRVTEQEHERILPPAGMIAQRYKEPLERGKGVDGLEQIVTAVDDRGEAGGGSVWVQEAPGKTWETMTTEEQRDIPPEHYDRLMNTLEQMEEKGVVIDNHASNIMYDPSAGFTIIDYHTREYWLGLDPELSATAQDQTFRLGGDRGGLTECGGELSPQEHINKFTEAAERKFGPDAANRIRQSWEWTQES